MYLSTRLPIALNALFKPLASEFIPAVAANATNARINTYSTRPWPDSSWCSRATELKTKVFIDVSLTVFSRIPTAGGAVDNVKEIYHLQYTLTYPTFVTLAPHFR